VLQHHLNATRDGHYIDPLMTKTYAANMMFDATFIGTSAGPGVPIGGPLLAQPLYVENGVGGHGTYYVADDSNDVYAIDEKTGTTVWSKTSLAMPAGMAGSGCGNITPVGITGTPIIDLTSRTLYLSAAIGIASGIQSQQIYALSIDDGSSVKGWPVNLDGVTSAAPSSITFQPQPQGQRSALALVNGYLYVAYGGEFGDCGDYHGWVVSIPVADPASLTAYATPANQGGIWGVGGVASDGTDVFATTGNGATTGILSWAQAGSEAVLRFTNGSAFDPTDTANFFTPSNWQTTLDPGDLDLGGSGPIVVDVPGATPSALIVQLGKSGVVHLLDRANLGGVGAGDGTNGEGVYSQQVAPGGEGSGLRTAGAAYTTSTGTYVVFHSTQNATTCPGAPGDLVAIHISATNPPTFTTAWCATTNGIGAPIVTTTDSSGSNAIVWVVGAENTNELYGWDGETGASIFDGTGTAMDTVVHFTTLIDVKGRLIVGASDKLYAFTGK
jgi:outer membrane protein assembly factor BamB